MNVPATLPNPALKLRSSRPAEDPYAEQRVLRTLTVSGRFNEPKLGTKRLKLGVLGGESGGDHKSPVSKHIHVLQRDHEMGCFKVVVEANVPVIPGSIIT